MKPFLKWAGSKQKIIDEVRDYLPKARRLIEPFVGSGAVFLGNREKYEELLLADASPDLIHLYTELRRSPEDFVRNAKSYFTPQNNTKEAYLAHRARFNALDHGSRERALLFLYLNRHGFNGLCRYNRKGEFNVAFGKYRRPYFPESELRDFAEAARRATVRVADFRETIRESGSGDVVYCDPPYVPLTATANFTQYQGAGFDLDDHRSLVQEAIEATHRGAVVLVSNHDTEVTRALYEDAVQVETLQVQRSIGVGKREKAPELVAIFKPDAQENPVTVPHPRGLRRAA